MNNYEKNLIIIIFNFENVKQAFGIRSRHKNKIYKENYKKFNDKHEQNCKYLSLAIDQPNNIDIVIIILNILNR